MSCSVPHWLRFPGQPLRLLAFWVLIFGPLSIAIATSESSEDEAERALHAAQAALIQKDWSQAELHLERALMFMPHHAQARLELAFLLVGRGRLAAAEVLITSLIEDSRTPNEHRVKLQALLSQLVTQQAELTPLPVNPHETQTALVPAWRFILDLHAGHATNPLGGSREKQITLTLDSGDFLLPIEPQDRSAALLGLGLSAFGPGGLRLAFQGQGLVAPIYRQQAAVSVTKPLGWVRSGEIEVGLSASHGLYNEQRSTASLGWVTDQLRATARFESGRQPTEQALGLRIDWRAGHWFNKGAGFSGFVFIEAEEGLQSVPSHGRMGLTGLMQLGEHTQVNAVVWHQRDTEGYSPLLKNNARRQLTQAQLSADRVVWQSQAAMGREQVYLRLAYAQRWSNLPLFRYADLQAGIGFRRHF